MHTLLLERLERHVLVERQCAITWKANGGKGPNGSEVTVPTFGEEVERLGRLLGEEDHRKRRDPEQQALIDALGLS